MVFYKQVLEFHGPSKFLCQTSGRQNHWSLLTARSPGVAMCGGGGGGRAGNIREYVRGTVYGGEEINTGVRS